MTTPRERSRREEAGIYPEEWLWDIQPLVGRDVSSSQIQILSVVLGLEDLEAEVTSQPFKKTQAARAWARAQDPADPFTLPAMSGGFTEGDPRLMAAIKDAVMTHLYGSELRQVAHKLRSDPAEFGPGLGDADNIGFLFQTTPGIKEMVSGFLGACQAAAHAACTANPYRGLVFTDPFDMVPMRWNPIQRRHIQLSSGPTKLYVSVPVGRPRSGEYPVDAEKLARMAAPCLVHALDAAFAGHVVHALHDRGVTDVVSVHDNWMVPAEAERLLVEAVLAAGEPWLRSLGPFYDGLLRYLRRDATYGTQVALWKATWERRVAAKRWPRFLVAPPVLWESDVREN